MAMLMHDEDEMKSTPPPPRLMEPSFTPPQQQQQQQFTGPDLWDQELRLFAPNWSNPTTQTHLNKRIARPPSAVLSRDRLADVAERRANQWLVEAERMESLMEETQDPLDFPRRNARPRRVLYAQRKRPSQMPVHEMEPEPSISMPEPTMDSESAPRDSRNA